MIAFWGTFLALDTATQLAFKAASGPLEETAFGLGFLEVALTTPAFWITVLCYIGTFACWMAVLARMDLNRAFPLTALTYVTVPLLAFVLFGEHLPGLRLIGIGVIIAGVVLIGWEE
jgi:multidrug transporter EmrE-like cation transporter